MLPKARKTKVVPLSNKNESLFPKFLKPNQTIVPLILGLIISQMIKFEKNTNYLLEIITEIKELSQHSKQHPNYQINLVCNKIV